MAQVSAVPTYIGDNLKGFDIRTSPFPGFPTDLQPQTMALLTTCTGSSLVEEYVFDKRMSHGMCEQVYNVSSYIAFHFNFIMCRRETSKSTFRSDNIFFLACLGQSYMFCCLGIILIVALQRILFLL